MKVIINIMASLLSVSIIAASVPYSSPTKHLSYVKNVESRKYKNKCAICRDLRFKPSWTTQEAHEHGKFLIKKVTANEAHGLHLLCLGRYRDQRHLVGYWSGANESQFRELIRGSFDHIIAGFIENQAPGIWTQYVELCSWIQEQDVIGTIDPLYNSENPQRLKEFLEVLILGGVLQSTSIIRILTSLAAAKMKCVAKEPVPENPREGDPECFTIQIPKGSDCRPQHRKREPHKASPYPPTSVRDRMYPTGNHVSRPIDSGIPAHSAVQSRSPAHQVIISIGQLSHPEEPQGAAQTGHSICYNSLISLRFLRTSTPEMLRYIMSFVFKSAEYSFGQKYDLLIFGLDHQSQFEDVKITEAVLVDLVKEYTVLHNDILLHFAFNDYRIYKMKFSPSTIVRVVDHYVASSSFNSIILIDLISILTESINRQSEGFKQIESLFEPQKYQIARLSHRELLGGSFYTLLRCYKSMSPVNDIQQGRRRILRELIMYTQEYIFSHCASKALRLIYLIKFVNKNSRKNMLLCFKHILKVADTDYRVTLYELFMPKDFQDDLKFLRELIKTDNNSAVKRFLKILASRNYIPIISFTSIICYLKTSWHSNILFYFARLVATHYELLEHEQGSKSKLKYRQNDLKRIQEYYTALCLERYFWKLPQYVNWITENMAKIIETTPADQWVLRMSYLSTSQCELIVDAYYQQTPLIISKCYEHVAEVQEQKDFVNDLLNGGILHRASRAVL